MSALIAISIGGMGGNAMCEFLFVAATMGEHAMCEFLFDAASQSPRVEPGFFTTSTA